MVGLPADIFIVFHLSTIYLQFIKVLHKQYAFDEENYKYSHTYRNMLEKEIQTQNSNCYERGVMLLMH